MKWDDLFDERLRVVVTHPVLIAKIGPSAAILYSQLFYWHGKGANAEGWITKASQDLEWETGITVRNQRRLRGRLEELGLVEVSYHNSSHSYSYRLDLERLRILIGPSVATRLDATPTRMVAPPATQKVTGATRLVDGGDTIGRRNNIEYIDSREGGEGATPNSEEIDYDDLPY